ncbi:hypothetical protein MRX96_059542 [Rhipicephalus microplus]
MHCPIWLPVWTPSRVDVRLEMAGVCLGAAADTDFWDIINTHTDACTDTENLSKKNGPSFVGTLLLKLPNTVGRSNDASSFSSIRVLCERTATETFPAFG